MALTYQLEKEKVGADHLNTEPQIKKEITFSSHVPDDIKNVAGFYRPGKAENQVCNTNPIERYNLETFLND